MDVTDNDTRLVGFCDIALEYLGHKKPAKSDNLAGFLWILYGALRVSTVLQNTERQLLNVPCDREFIDKASGKDTNRLAFKEMMSQLRAGDLVNVHSLDRAGRNTADILKIVDRLRKRVVPSSSIKFIIRWH